MHILTVTCWQDISQFLLQLHSIKQYLTGNYTHYIVINEDFTDGSKNNKDIWHSSVYEIYQDHINYEIIFPEWNNEWGDRQYGWRSQQIFKFFYYNRIADDYVILDSKNFFVRNVDIDDFKGMIGSGMIGIPSGNFNEINQVYAKHFNCPILEDPLTPWTPFVVEYNVLQNYSPPNDLAKTLLSLSTNDALWPSEFIFYSYLVKEKLSNTKSLVISASPIFFSCGCARNFSNVIRSSNIKIASVHRRALCSMNKKHKKVFDDFLTNFNLPKLLKIN